MTKQEIAFMQGFKSGEMSVTKRTQVLVEGSISPHIYTVLRGILTRFKTLEDGRRQIVNYAFPGDLLGIQGAMKEPLGHGVEALTDATLCVFSRERVHELFSQQPALGFDMTWLSAKEESALEAHLTAVGQRTARERVLYLALFLYLRGRETGMTRGQSLKISVTQSQIAETVGLSLVHTNRVMQNLRKSGIVVWNADGIKFADLEAATTLAQYEHHIQQQRPYI